MSLSRREFLRTSSLATLGAAAATACTGGGPNGSAFPREGTIDEILAGRQQRLQYIGVGTELLANVAERLAFGLVVGGQLMTGAPGRIWFAKERTEPALGPFEMVFHGDGLPDDRGYYEAQVTFPSEGTWLVLVEAGATPQDAQIGAGQAQVGRRNTMPKPGDPAISVHTPTTQHARGVDPICTATPACGMHDHSLANALDAGDKIVLMIATPAYCTSKLCGPEVEMLDEVRAQTDGVTFIHAEVLANDDPDTVRTFNPLAPAAKAWNLEEEPACYLIADGRVHERLLGPADRATFRDAVARLVQA